jgi:hypothetical protein
MRSEPCDFETMGDIGVNLLVTFDMVTENNIHQEHVILHFVCLLHPANTEFL